MQCRRQLVELQSHYDEIKAAGGEALAVSTDDLRGAESAVANFGAEFPILYTSGDPTVPYLYGRFDRFGDGLASAAVFIIDTDGSVAWSSIGDNYRHQVSAEEIIAELEGLR